MVAIEALARMRATEVAQVEFTTRCNLNCSYCRRNIPKIDLDIDTNYIISELKSCGIKSVIMHGCGETTVMDNWVDIANSLHNAGMNVIICSNMIKKFTDEEYMAFTKMHHITVSIDTVDPEAFGERRGGSVQQLIYNVVRIRAMQTHPISWGICCVLTDDIADGLLDLAKVVKVLGIGAFRVSHIFTGNSATKPSDKVLNAARVVKQYCAANGIMFDVVFDSGGYIER